MNDVVRYAKEYDVNMLDSNGNLAEEAKKQLSPEEVEMFNALPKVSATWMLERQSVAIKLLSAAMQRKALFDVEERGRKTTSQANLIAILAVSAIVLQTIVEVILRSLGW
jgi:hypothetical protein